MKKQLLAIALLHSAVYAHAQTPHAIPYQAAARTSSGAVIASQPVGVRFTIRDSAATGTVLYSETHSPTTTAQGLFIVQIGQGTPVAGSFSGINWGHNAKYLQVELDASGGTTYTHIGTQQFLSVPYALYAETAGGNNGWADSAGMLHNINATGRVGIGTNAPSAQLHVAGGNVVFTGNNEFPWGYDSVTVPTNGPGYRMMWIPAIGAFRVGYTYDNFWSADSLGPFSIAMGEGPTASGLNATAIGHFSMASGYSSVALGESRAYDYWSTAIGHNNAAYGISSLALGESTISSGENAATMGKWTTASGINSLATGFNTVASGETATAMGSNAYATGASSLATGSGTVADGFASTAMGSYSYANASNATAIGIGNTASAYAATALGIGVTASGAQSTALGSFVQAQGEASMAMGVGTVASGDYSTAMGANASTNYKTGAFAIGDNSGTGISNNADNQMVMRFAGGYKLYNDTFATKGIHITPSGPVKYLTNVTALFDDRSLVDKHYVDSVAAGSSTTSNWATAGTDAYNTNTGRIGIGTSTPKARLHVADSSVVFTGGHKYHTLDEFSMYGDWVPDSNEVDRVKWYANKAAFRAGGPAYLITPGSLPTPDWTAQWEWSDNNIGYYSFGAGLSAMARGDYSCALGNGYRNYEGGGGYPLPSYAWGKGAMALAGGLATENGSIAIGGEAKAFGERSLALGDNATATGIGATAIGKAAQASGESAFATGVNSQASATYAHAIGAGSYASNYASTAVGIFSSATGNTACAIGNSANASGEASIALGNGSSSSGESAIAIGMSTASGSFSTALGKYTMASGDLSTAMGNYVSTNYKEGSFAIGDASLGMGENDADNQMMMRFAGGYKLYSNSSATVGVALDPSSNSWSVISDKRKKENFLPIDGNGILKKIGAMPLSSWNYKGQDPKTYRHYGPMAQDFYAAFGNDGVGMVGNDTTINQADMAGVTFAAVQALVSRDEQQQKEIDLLKKQNEELMKQNEVLKATVKKYNEENNVLKAEVTNVSTNLQNRLEILESMSHPKKVTATTK